jgi:hypothetical protein
MDPSSRPNRQDLSKHGKGLLTNTMDDEDCGPAFETWTDDEYEVLSGNYSQFKEITRRASP